LKLHHLLDEQLIKLSNGETRRLLIAAALLQHPVVLLLTSPFSGLDVASRADFKELVNEVASSGITVVMSASTTEIPGAVTHVASFNNDNTITTEVKENFDAKVSIAPAVSTIDAAEVQSLMRINPLPVFSEVVKMVNVNIRYDNKLILDNINWTIRQGERWVLSGPNGAGKSTLLSLINGDNPQAFANNIVLFDRKKGSGESIWDIKKKIGFFSPELYQYFPLETSCLQAVESGFYDTIGLFRPSSPQLVSIALRWMKVLEVDHLKGKLLQQVSPVHQRLCLLARAFVKAPALLILDEPCQGFDDKQRTHFKQLLNTICASGNVTLIYVSHYKEEIPECVTKELRLDNGRRSDGL
jgi:molybdate transport system ATP-binding protein